MSAHLIKPTVRLSSSSCYDRVLYKVMEPWSGMLSPLPCNLTQSKVAPITFAIRLEASHGFHLRSKGKNYMKAGTPGDRKSLGLPYGLTIREAGAILCFSTQRFMGMALQRGLTVIDRAACSWGVKGWKRNNSGKRC